MVNTSQSQQREIPLPNAKSDILAKVIEFCRQYCLEPMTVFEKVGL
jgi:hypothetical protein